MDQNRRDFLKGAGIAAAIAATGGLTVGNVEAQPVKTNERGMASRVDLVNHSSQWRIPARGQNRQGHSGCATGGKTAQHACPGYHG
ncbi:MAG: twin-arginine translocation signal domain-containing protein [Desulfomonilaceae bacterium]